MLNPDFSIFNDNMFVQVRKILDPLSIKTNLLPLNLTIGEPQIPPPEWLNSVLIKESRNWQAYPKAFASEKFLDDISHYFENRFPSVAHSFAFSDHIVPVPGTREPLHLLGYCVKGAKENSTALVSNPFYHAWRAGALASGGEIIYLNATADTGFLADLDRLDEAVLARTSILYLCNPTNPHGVIVSKAYIEKAILLARAHNFLLVMDECYIDIWRRQKPLSALEVAASMAENDPSGDDMFANLIVLNSLSKRSSAAGLRAGFLCGDRRAIAAYKQVVANGGALVPTPLLHAAGALYRDEAHNQQIRAHYDTSFDLLSQQLEITVPEGGFFLWLAVPDALGGDDEEMTKQLYQQAGISVIPGSVMATTSEHINPGAGYVRLAIVHDHDTISEAARRLARFLSDPQIK
ncbi:aminotransferase class I/II-fold pyridoxal phosphate-dependent enzyme [Alphaproteobacteria bacterium]|nr:aminotransferase class I/II-fold pyridoxal phosphate-dependent enzyme [Alphaproteobacteria bacterium]